MEQDQWRVRCHDSLGHRKEMTVFSAEGNVVIASPRETLILRPMEVGRLRAALRDAAVEAATSDRH